MRRPKSHSKAVDKRTAGKISAQLEKAHQEQILRQRIAQDAHALYESLVEAARGVSHMMARDKDGTWKEVTDPAVMAKVLNSGEQFYRIHARNPDTRALINLFDRLVGSPTQAVQQEHSGAIVIKHELG